MSHHILNIKANERVARAEVPCLHEQPVWDEQPSRRATHPRAAENLRFKTDTSVTPEHCKKLGRLIQKYRGCFGDSVSEKKKAAEMKVEVTTEEPIRFRA
ncbi:hypothetical protein HPB50_010207 [Hyalomma asiaticum]|uniref:Uncharacterized protein n=1 Tax=Hyalomma asiaticum TaxID=266040 RepID=A0ACB7RYI0_HYAAI|nr:hypothetical protein HPB50_010207 [Hyalomma asiaticum]